MANIHPFTLEREIGGKTIRFEAGRLAHLADGAVLATMGETQVLVTTTSGDPREQFDFFPLTVDVEERMYAAGKIPGGFFRREGRAPETAILTCRLIDRPMRPSFPKGFRNEVQVISTVLSVDHVNPYDVLSITGASMSTLLGGLPFEGPVGGLRMGFKDGKWLPFPTFQEIEDCTFDLVVAGALNPDGDVRIIMVEAEATENSWFLIKAGHAAPTEQVVAQGLEEAKIYLRELCEMQNEFLAMAGGATKREFPTFPDYSEDVFEQVRSITESGLGEALTISDKAEREARLDEIKADMKERLGGDEALAARATEFSPALRSLTKQLVRKRIVSEGIRIDGRKVDEIRQLSADVNVLPRAHGTGLFQRGETQVLSIATLGMMRMTQMIDTLDPTEEKRYMHHYNFPPFSTGEARPLRGPKRRDIGHGALAERALLPVVPPEDEFPYAIRVVSEVLSSNGSTSMASVCGSTLSLMDAGVPLHDMVAGIAMGLIYEDGEYITLTDILGAEDAFGDMDFKVAGTEDFVTALQLDTKLTGVPSDVLARALDQARTARLQILDTMRGAIAAPRTELSSFAPKIITVQVPVDKIGEVIGPKGKKINEIQAETGAEIDIQDDGRIFIASKGGDGAERAREMIEQIANPVMPEAGLRFEGKIVGVREGLGLFVSVPSSSKDGLVHISKLGFGQRVERVEGTYNVGDSITVEVQKVDEALGKISLSPIHPETGERYDGPERKPREGGDRGDRGGRSDRGGRDRGSRDRGPRRERSERPADAPHSDAPHSDAPHADAPAADQGSGNGSGGEN